MDFASVIIIQGSTMKVLFITRSFAPDNNIASKRITMLVKYLNKLGHEITVIRSGLIIGKAETKNLDGLNNVKIYSYEGDDCAAECFEKYGKIQNMVTQEKNSYKDNISFFFRWHNFLKRFGHIVLDPFIYSKYEGEIIKNKIVNLYNSCKDIRGYDAIISTFSPLGCIQAAEYIRSQEKATWIIDFRDLMNNGNYTFFNRIINSFRQMRFVEKADACLCVSEGNRQKLIGRKEKYSGKIFTIYNGYEKDEELLNQTDNKEKHVLRLCYTGTIYKGKQDFSPLFKVLRENRFSMPIVIDYAGHNSDIIIEQAKKSKLENMIIDHGFLSRSEVSELQKQADIFLVLSWNTKHDQGILTGKFYEALQHRKPIIALVNGNMPQSELKELIEQYHLGICYENASKVSSQLQLLEYIEKQIAKKQNNEELDYKPNESVFGQFNYMDITKQLEQIIIKMTNKQ